MTTTRSVSVRDRGPSDTAAPYKYTVLRPVQNLFLACVESLRIGRASLVWKSEFGRVDLANAAITIPRPSRTDSRVCRVRFL